MQQMDLISVAILWCIGLLALIQTINARGAVRASLSGIVTVLILIAAAFFSYIKYSDYKELVVPGSEQGTLASAITQSSAVAAPGREASKENTVENYTAAAEKLVADALDNIKAIDTFEKIPDDASESARETAESKALSIRNQTARINQQAVELFHPRSVSDLHTQLVRATENLRLSGYSLHAYTTLSDSLKEVQYEQYSSQAKLAEKALNAYAEKLRKLE